MASESGYSNAKKQGAVQHKTIHDLGSSRFGQHVVTKALADRSAIPVAIVTVVKGTNKKEEPLLQLEITAHGASKGDTLKFTTGPIAGAELEVVSITDANNIIVRDVLDILPTAGNLVSPMYFVTSKSDKDGNANFSPGPTQFVRNGSSSQVILDTVTPANTKGLPSQLVIVKDGIQYPVTKDSGTPANTVAIPVEIVSVGGTTINVTAGDINVQLTDIGAVADKVRLGDGSGNYVGVTLASEAKVKDTDVLVQVSSLNAKSPSLVGGKVPVDTGMAQGLTDAQLRLAPLPVTGTVVTGGLTDTQLRASPLAVTGALTNGELRGAAVVVSGPLTDAQLRTAALGVTSLQLPVSLGQKIGADSLSVVFASGTTVTTTVTGMSTEVKQDAAAVLTGALAEVAPASDTASSGLNGRLQRIAQRITSLIALFPATLGTKLSSASFAVVLASDQAALPTTEAPRAASYQENLAVSTTVTTFTAPAGTKWCKIHADSSNVANLRVKLGGVASITSGHPMEPGRSEDFEVGANISVCSESGAGNKIYVTFGA